MTIFAYFHTHEINHQQTCRCFLVALHLSFDAVDERLSDVIACQHTHTHTHIQAHTHHHNNSGLELYKRIHSWSTMHDDDCDDDDDDEEERNTIDKTITHHHYHQQHMTHVPLTVEIDGRQSFIFGQHF
jgi:hypothetical protein